MENAVKPSVLELLDQAREDEKAFAEGLDEAERAASGTPEHWSVKDVLWHIAAWKQREVQRLAAVARDETPPSYDDLDAVNAAIFAEGHHRSWDQVLHELEHVDREVRAYTSRLTEEDLRDPQRFAWRKGEPLWTQIVLNSYTHPEQHLAEFYRDHGDMPRAAQVMEEVTARLIDLDGSPRSRGTSLYNLACFYALSHESAHALSLLQEALPLRPDLVEWSKHDSDLDSLRDLPEYQALSR